MRLTILLLLSVVACVSAQLPNYGGAYPPAYGGAPIGAAGGIPLGGYATGTVPSVLPQNYGNPNAMYGQLQQPILSAAQVNQLIPNAQLQQQLNARVASLGATPLGGAGVAPTFGAGNIGGIGQQQFGQPNVGVGAFNQPQVLGGAGAFGAQPAFGYGGAAPIGNIGGAWPQNLGGLGGGLVQQPQMGGFQQPLGGGMGFQQPIGGMGFQQPLGGFQQGINQQLPVF